MNGSIQAPNAFGAKGGALVFMAEPWSCQNQFAASSWTLETVKYEND
jgi:hypothetical protein